MSEVTITKQHLDFIPRIYDTVTNPDCWRDVLDEFANFCGAPMGTLILHDRCYSEFTNLASVEFTHTARAREYFEKHGPEDAAAVAVGLTKPVGEWIDDETLFGMPVDEIPGTQFQIKHFDLKHRAVVRLNDSPLWIDGLSLNFKADRGGLTPEEAAIGDIFVPHFAKAVEMKRPFALLNHRYQAVFSVLDRLQIGLLITNSEGEIVISNNKGDDALAAGNGIRKSPTKHLQIHPENLNQQLLEDIRNCSDPARNSRHGAVMIVPKSDDGQPWVLEVMPLSDMDGNIDGRFQGAMVFVTDPDQKHIISTEGIGQLFQLTQAESEIYRLIVDGLKTEDVAESRNVSIGTVRSQIRSLFDKTQTNSRLDLVRLALQVNLPVERRS